MAIVNWDDYSSLYSKIEQTEFDRYEALAEKEVKKVIGAIRWATIETETFGYEELKDCICNVMNRLFENENSGRGRGIASVSNDGYSETYTLTSESALHDEMVISIREWLSGTGLVGAY